MPSDTVTASASGLDPHISPANAVSAGRHASPGRAARIRPPLGALLDAHVEGRQFGFFGEPRVNVLMLNIALDSAFAKRTATVR